MKRIALSILLLVSGNIIVRAQGSNPITGADSTFQVITTAVPFLTISPDSRNAALGDAGVSNTPDANSAYWNPAKLTFITKAYGGSLSYTPWLGKIVNDMWISYLTGFYKITREQTVALSMKYFDLGDISFRDNNNEPLGDFNPRELSLDLTYSRMLTESFGVGLTGRYIYSNLTGSTIGIDAQPINSAAVDLGVYYSKELKSTRSSTLSLGGVISNIGPKVSYTDDANKNFLPTNLRLGGTYKMDLDPFNSLAFLLDFNKLLVPTEDEGQTVLEGMFESFSDAPGGFSEEMKEIIINMGIEYWYNEIFAGRIGYFSESKDKGNRKYMTLGVGFRNKKNFGIDVAYLVPTNGRENALAETIRFSLLFQVDTKRVEESVTD